MKKPFKTLLGNRLYVIAPEVTSDKIHLSNSAKKEMAKLKMKDLMRLKVYAVGDSVKGIVEGDEILVSDIALSTAPIIDLEKDLSVILISYFDVVHIW